MLKALAALSLVLAACTPEPAPLPSCAAEADYLEGENGFVVEDGTVCGGFSDGAEDVITFRNFAPFDLGQIQLHALDTGEGAPCLEDLIVAEDLPAGAFVTIGNCFQLTIHDVPFRGTASLTFSGPESEEYFFAVFFFRAQ